LPVEAALGLCGTDRRVVQAATGLVAASQKGSKYLQFFVRRPIIAVVVFEVYV